MKTTSASSSETTRTRRLSSSRISLRANHLREYWPLYIPAAAGLLLAATITRGLWWQWTAIFTASPPVQPPIAAAPAPAPPIRNPAQTAAQSAAGNPAPAPVSASGKRPLPPTNDPPPRNTTDQYGVTYDAQGVAVMGIDADPGGVYNVPPGRQVRIGGPSGTLFDVGPNGQLTPAAQVRS